MPLKKCIPDVQYLQYNNYNVINNRNSCAIKN